MLGMMEQLGLTDMDEIAEISAVDRIEASMASEESIPAVCPLEHFFTPGLYTRMIHMPANTLVVSRKHKTQHPFFILKGKVAVMKDNGKGEMVQEGLFEAGYMGITQPDTKRVLFNIEDTTWVTCHSNPNDIEDPDQIALNITEDTINPLIDKKENPRFNTWKKENSPSIIHKELLIS